ncbi:MAG: D-cysteine desulfhydrase family protein [Armatimonadetes bacterium]|nr:D-cysteine desulfhydrase family protein [Armatimonadota bacterium]
MLHCRIPLTCDPTPLHRLDRLSEKLGIDLWIKRDDLSGFGGGGNKGRKLEYLIADALDQGADTFVTQGASQSNFVRQSAAACGVHGIEFHAVTMYWPHPGSGRETKPGEWPEAPWPTANQVLDSWLGANIHLYPDGTFDDLSQHAAALADELRKKGRKVYQSPSGGSNPIGALGFVRAIDEISQQAEPFDRIVVASGSGGTQGGMAYGLRRTGLKTHLIGVATDKEPELADVCASIAGGLDALLLGKLRMTRDDIDLRMEYAGAGYQVPSEDAQDATRILARTEGIFLDPVYTSKAFAGFLDLAEKGELTGRTLFWHTGGFPTIFAEGRLPS